MTFFHVSGESAPLPITATTTNLKPIRRKSIQKNKNSNNNNSKTHSRESSGASNLSVKFSVSDETASVSTAASNPSRLGSRNSNSPETEGEVEEDLTLRYQSFTSLMADLRQDINRVASFSMCLYGSFP